MDPVSEQISASDEFSWLLSFDKLSTSQILKIRDILTSSTTNANLARNAKAALTAFEPMLHQLDGRHHTDELYWRFDERIRDKFNNYLECLQRLDIISLMEFEDDICAPFVTDTQALAIPGL